VSKDREQVFQEVSDAFRRQGQAGDILDDAVCRYMGIHRTDARLIDVLHMAGRMSAGELATAGRLSPAAVTAALDRLERAGYVRRLRDERDRRRVLVELTERMHDLTGELYGPLSVAGRRLMEELSDEQLRLLRDFVEQATKLQLDRAARIEELVSEERGPGPRPPAGTSAG
jgi:DNA-binding MarR family transcriptional regulator